jgi:hypothetical protein
LSVYLLPERSSGLELQPLSSEVNIIQSKQKKETKKKSRKKLNKKQRKQEGKSQKKGERRNPK